METSASDVYSEEKWGKASARHPTWRDKLLQEAMRLILEAHYEPRFSPSFTGSDLDGDATPRWVR